MESKFKILGHGAHPILIVFPLGLLATAAIFDIIYLLTQQSQIANAAYWMIAAGVVGGIVAAVPGFVDWWAIPAGTRAKRVGLFTASATTWCSSSSASVGGSGATRPPRAGDRRLILSMLGRGAVAVHGLARRELVERLGVAVHDGAHLDAPNTLSGAGARPRIACSVSFVAGCVRPPAHSEDEMTGNWPRQRTAFDTTT
jgi:hypothetical protein